jgi:hypothetical protein
MALYWRMKRDPPRILGQSRNAVLELRGQGIGHVYGKTGREIGDQQQITACQITLSRKADGLELELTGKLAPLAYRDRARSLGPAFEASLFIPIGYLMLRQWPIDQLLEERRERFGIQNIWL